MASSGIFDKRLVFVTGKGGVGKTTVAAALGLAAARAGKRTIVCEVAQQERISTVFGRKGVGHSETKVAPRLFAMSIDPQRSMEEYLREQVGAPLYGLLFENRLFQYLAAATPGMRELLTMGKIWELAQLERRSASAAPYDVVIVDAPATGHGLGFLRTPRTFREAARVGKIRRQADIIDGFISDPTCTGVVTVAVPEEMPVNETLDFRDALRDEMGMDIDAVVVNAVYPERFSDEEAEQIERAVDSNGSPGVLAALRAGLFEHHRAVTQRADLFQPDLDRAAFELLSQELEAGLGPAGYARPEAEGHDQGAGPDAPRSYARPEAESHNQGAGPDAPRR
jgi:anion-transporting  ArsA/GET3 family ATPase